MESFFRIATLVVFVLTFATSAYFRTRAAIRGGQLRSKVGQRPVMLLRLLGLLMWLPLLGYLLAPETVAWARVDLPDGLRLAALLVIAVDSALVLWMFRSLGLNITPVHEARERATLVTHGPYRWIRHPLYTFGFIFLLALAVLTGLWWLAACSVVFLAFLAWRTPREEARLIEIFGDAYREYMRHTGRFFPKVGSSA
jgi:protein-S-isoprenylcysteine O-methyltransferase Ste14